MLHQVGVVAVGKAITAAQAQDVDYEELSSVELVDRCPKETCQPDPPRRLC